MGIQSAQRKFAGDLESRAIGPNATISGKVKGGDRYALTTFGKPSRNMNCDCERTLDPTLLQTIYARNDPALLRLLDDRAGWIEELRRSTSAEHSPERLRADLAKLEVQKVALLQRRADAEKEVAPSDAAAQIDRRLQDVEGRITRTRASLADAPATKPFHLEDVVGEIFLRTLSRLPTPAEVARAKEDIRIAPTPIDGVREILWAMLNTREFMVNH